MLSKLTYERSRQGKYCTRIPLRVLPYLSYTNSEKLKLKYVLN